MTTKLESWLALTEEEALEPGLPICDPHHHLWDRPPNGRYFLEDVLRDMSGGHNVVQSVFVECRSMYRKNGPEEMTPIGETEFVQGIAAQSRSGLYGDTKIANGIVSFADLALGAAVEPVLEAHRAVGRSHFKGVRHVTAWDAHPDLPRPRPFPQGLLLDAKFREGFAVLDKMGLSFDAYVYFHQLNEVAGLAGAFPGVTIILDHVGAPLGIGPYAGKADEVRARWKEGIAAVAAHPNVVAKIGGMPMSVSGFGWHERALPPASREVAETLAPYYLYCVEQFGVERCMFESNFPVDKLSCSYTVIWNAFKRMTQDFSPSDRAALFHDTAARVYRLG